jgi:hypothetical protein
MVDHRQQPGEEARGNPPRDAAASLNDYDGKTLGQLGPQVEPLLTNDPSHPGKLRAIGGAVNRPSTTMLCQQPAG